MLDDWHLSAFIFFVHCLVILTFMFTVLQYYFVMFAHENLYTLILYYIIIWINDIYIYIYIYIYMCVYASHSYLLIFLLKKEIIDIMTSIKKQSISSCKGTSSNKFPFSLWWCPGNLFQIYVRYVSLRTTSNNLAIAHAIMDFEFGEWSALNQ